MRVFSSIILLCLCVILLTIGGLCEDSTSEVEDVREDGDRRDGKGGLPGKLTIFAILTRKVAGAWPLPQYAVQKL